MKKIFIVSLTVNMIFFLLFGYIIYKKGEFTCLQSKPGLKKEMQMSSKPNWYYKNFKYWQDKKTLFEVLPNSPNEIIFLGNSITDGCEWAELFNNPLIKNRGIGGDNTEGILERLGEITDSHPKKIFIGIGLNDLTLKETTFLICENYKQILDKIRSASPTTKIYIQSVLPTNNYETGNDSIIFLNNKIKEIANYYQLTYIDLFSEFVDKNGELDMQYSFDGVHLNGQGYLLWKKIIEQMVSE